MYKSIPGYEGLYEVSDSGEIRSIERKCRMARGIRSVSSKILKHLYDKDGYPMVSLAKDGKQKLWRIHRLVLLAFVGPLPEGKESRHLDDVKINNNLSNLCYGTQLENWEDRKRNGNGINGYNNPNAKLTPDQILKIKALHGEISFAEIGRRFSISDTHAGTICKGK